MLVMILININKKIIPKNDIKNPTNKLLSLPSFSLDNGKIGLSIICIKGVSFNNDIFAISKFVTNWDKIAVFV
jgi:hypothetical protein